MRCSVQNCNNDTRRTTKNDGVTFHLFPKEPNLRKTWMDALKVSDWEPKERSTICSEHFRDDDFYLTKGGLRKIKNGAVPVNMENDLMDLDSPATMRVCRICLVMNVKMCNLKEFKICEAYERVTGNLLSEQDTLPQKICWECAHRLSVCDSFRNKALRSHIVMMRMLEHSQYLTIRNVISIDRSRYHLESRLVQKMLKPVEYSVEIKNDDELFMKNEAENLEVAMDDREDDDNYEDDYVKEESADVHRSVAPATIIEVQIKDENASNDNIFIEEFTGNNHFDESDDNKALSEVIPQPKQRVKKKHMKKKLKKNGGTLKRKLENDSPTATMNKYKNTFDLKVRRRKIYDALDETLFTITTLTYEEQIAEIEKRQESPKYTGAPYKCTTCYRGFLTKDRYNAHVIRHSDQSGEYECFICKSRMKSSRALRKHLTAQHTEKFSCKGCPFVTRNRGVAREHEKWHSGSKYQCPHCPSEFEKLTTYLGHIRIKHVSDFVCELCGYTFVSEKGIEVHKKKKHRLQEANVPIEGPYCEVCDVRFVSEDAHERHLKLSSRHSSDDDPNRIRNDSQSMYAERKGRYGRRVERRPVIHPRDPADAARRPEPTGPVPCEQCGIQLRDLRLYAQHFRRAHPDKNRTKYPAMKTPCMCEQCGRIFQSMALLKDHMWVHTGEKRFKCDRCDKSFTQKTNLVFHMRVHSATRPSYECPLCGKHFAFYNNRRRHMFIHTGLKPFKCDTCGKCFTTAGEQRAHVEHVHLKKPWPKRARARHQHEAWHK